MGPVVGFIQLVRSTPQLPFDDMVSFAAVSWRFDEFVDAIPGGTQALTRFPKHRLTLA